MPQAAIKQIKGLQSTLDALSGVTTIKETISTNIPSGNTGFGLAYDAREIDGISVHVNGVKVETYSWIDGSNNTITSTLVPAGSFLFWDSSSAGFDLSSTDVIEVSYETLAGGAIAFDSSGNYTSSGSGTTGAQGATGAQGPQGPAGVETPEHIREFFNLYRSRLPYAGPNESDVNKYRLLDNYMNLTQSDEVFKIGYDPALDGSTDYGKSLRMLHAQVGYFNLSDDARNNIGTTWLHKENGETLTYKSGSLRGHFERYAQNPSFLGSSDTSNMDNSRLFVIGFENLDPTWPSTNPAQMPTLLSSWQTQYGDGSSQTHYIDQHIRAKLLDAYTLSGNYLNNSTHLISSDYIGFSDIDITNYVAISVFLYSPDTPSNRVCQGYVHYTILRS